MTIYAVIPVHNRIELTLQFLDSLDAQEADEDIQVLIVDDGSTDGTSAIIDERDGRFPVDVIQGSGNLWWAGATKNALRALVDRARPTDWIYLGNNDTVLHPKHILYLCETARSIPNSVIGSRSFEVWPDGTQHPVSSGFRIHTHALSVIAIPGNIDVLTEVDALAARGILFSASILNKVHINSLLTPQHFADISMTSRLKRKGIKLLVDHRAASTQTARSGSAIELSSKLHLSFRKRDPLFVPAIAYFWASQIFNGSLCTPFPRRSSRLPSV